MHYERLHLLKKETSVMVVCITSNGIYHDCNLYYDDVPRITLICLFPSHFFLCAIRSQSAKQGTHFPCIAKDYETILRRLCRWKIFL